MLLGVVLLYVGAVLVVNGIWLVGAAYAARAASREPAAEARTVGARVRAGYGGEAAAVGAEELGGAVVEEPPGVRAQGSPIFIQNREVAVLNIFTGFIGVVIAIVLIVVGATASLPAIATGVALGNVRLGAFILLFAFTYLWVAFNQYLNAGGRAFGWYCLFVAITAVPAGIFIFTGSGRGGAVVPLNTTWIWAGVNWFAWALLWAMFFAVLTLDRALSKWAIPLGIATGIVAIAEGIGTSWALAFALLEGKLTF